jgi:hypothetical protein
MDARARRQPLVPVAAPFPPAQPWRLGQHHCRPCSGASTRAVDIADRDEVAEVAASRLVAVEWYRATNVDVAAVGLDPVEHFCRFGWREGRAPNPWFDPAWYLLQNRDVAAAMMNPLLHYLRHGEPEGRKPSAYFDPTWYRGAHGLGDRTFALDHYLKHVERRCFSPCAALYAAAHVSRYRDSSGDCYLQCVQEAALAGLTPCPDIDVVTGSALLDPNYYFINGSDVREAALDPAKHFCCFGWRENRKPNIYFDTSWYRQTNPVVARLGLNPLVHYICEGEAAGRRPAVYFDPIWYRDNYPDALATTGLSPLAHYRVSRRSQSFSPNRHFDVQWYIERHGEVVGPNRDPFAHYLQTGTTSDIDPSGTFDAALYRRCHMGRLTRGFRARLHPDRDNPLVHFLRADYR